VRQALWRAASVCPVLPVSAKGFARSSLNPTGAMGSGGLADNLAPGVRGEARTLWHFSRPQARRHAALAMPGLRVARCRWRVTAGYHRPAGSGDSRPALGAASSARPRAERARQADATGADHPPPIPR
jgi:hypothetical protein